MFAVENVPAEIHACPFGSPIMCDRIADLTHGCDATDVNSTTILEGFVADKSVVFKFDGAALGVKSTSGAQSLVAHFESGIGNVGLKFNNSALLNGYTIWILWTEISLPVDFEGILSADVERAYIEVC